MDSNGFYHGKVFLAVLVLVLKCKDLEEFKLGWVHDDPCCSFLHHPSS